MEKSKTKEYYTKDLYEASYLYAEGQNLLRLQREERFSWFVFEDKGAESISKAYWAGEGSINPRGYADAIRTLKDYLFSKR